MIAKQHSRYQQQPFVSSKRQTYSILFKKRLLVPSVESDDDDSYDSSSDDYDSDDYYNDSDQNNSDRNYQTIMITIVIVLKMMMIVIVMIKTTLE